MSDVDLDEIPKTYADAVCTLARWHAESVDGVRIYSIPDVQKRVVRLAEVSDEFPRGVVERPSASGELEPVVPVFPLGPSSEFPYASGVVQVTSDEWAQLLAGELKLTKPWDLARRVEIEL